MGSFCTPEAYDHQYRRYCQHIVKKTAEDTTSAGARGPSIVPEEREHCCDKHGYEAGYRSFCCAHHAPRLFDPRSDCPANELLLSDDFNSDFWNDSVVLQNILDTLRDQQKRELARITAEIPPLEPEDILKAVDGGTMLHQGLRRTWLLLNKLFPGHRIPMRKVQDFLDQCPTC